MGSCAELGADLFFSSLELESLDVSASIVIDFLESLGGVNVSQSVSLLVGREFRDQVCDLVGSLFLLDLLHKDSCLGFC